MIDRSLIEIVPAKQVHLDEVAAIERANFPCPWKRDYFLHELFLPWRFHRVIVYTGEGPFRGRAIAYIFCHYVIPELHISKIASHKEFHRQGLATILMNDLSAFCGAKGIHEITLEVRVSNMPARTFYYGLGFKDDYVRKKYYPDGEDAMCMCWRRTAGENGGNAGTRESGQAGRPEGENAGTPEGGKA
jgi:ribosomal-protein-alanine N-acetyltransferase